MTQLVTLGRVRLSGEASDRGAPVAAQPKRVALLTYLAIASDKGPVRRDLLVALFWPELGDDEARRALRQSLHYLRRTLGEGVVTGSGEDLTVHREQLWCDAVEFERLAASGEDIAALSLYKGDFLTGFHVPDVSSELEEWVDRTRARLRRHASGAAWNASEAAERRGEPVEAVELARRACELEPDQEGGWRKLMLLQARLNDRGGALRTYDELSARLRREFDADPSAESAALAETLRSERQPPVPRQSLTESAVVTTPPASDEVAPAVPTSTNSRRPPLPAVVIVFAVLAAAIVLYRTVARRPHEPTLLESGAIEVRDRVLVADFAITGGDSGLAIAITDAFRVDIAQSPNIRVMTPRQILSALQRMERTAELALNDSLAREVAMREGVKALVTGRVARLGERWTLTVELVGAESGEAITAVRETARDSSELIDAVGRASEQLRSRLGESVRELHAEPPLAQEVTASLPALRKYTAAMRLFYGGDRTGAIPLLNEAVALDSTFSSAYLSLAHIYEALAEPGRSEQARQRAMAHLERLPFQDRQVLLGGDAFSRGDYRRAIQAYDAYARRFPHYAPAINNLALAHREAGHLVQAESLWKRSIEVDSSIIQLYFGLQSVQMLAGNFADSRQTLDLIGRRSPGNGLLLTVEVQDAAAQQDWPTAERRAEANIASKQGDTLNLVDAFEQMAGIVMTQGRLEEAERYWRTQQELSAASDSWGRRLFGTQMLGWIRLRFTADTTAALAILDSSLRRMPLDSILPEDRPLGDLARFFAAAGQPERARAYMARLATNGRDGPARRAQLEWAEGTILLQEGRAAAAEPLLRRASQELLCAICALPDLARAREALGDIVGAIEAWERYLRTPWLFRYEVDSYELGPALLRLANLYDLQGERQKARNARTRVLALWRRADASLQPMLADARTRLTISE